VFAVCEKISPTLLQIYCLFYTTGTIVDNFITGSLTGARTDVKTGLAVCLAELEHQNLVSTIGQFLGSATKSSAVLYKSCAWNYI
jgi:hypothetical protein